MEITPLRVLIYVIAFIVLILVALVLVDQRDSSPLSSVVLGSAVVGAGLALRAGKTHDAVVYRMGGAKSRNIDKSTTDNLVTVAPTMLNDEQKLINYAVPPVAVYSLVQTADAVPVGSHTDFVIEAGTRETLERMKFPSGGRQLYGLVIDKPGDMVALYKAVAINIGLNPPPDIKSKSADRTKGASGWLYDIVRAADSDIHALRLRTYIKSSEYAVST
jgi:hypothetical protein